MLSHGKWRENELHIYVLRLRPGSEITILISLLRQRIMYDGVSLVLLSQVPRTESIPLQIATMISMIEYEIE